MMNEQAIMAAIRSRGVDRCGDNDIRHAAHEAAHGIRLGVKTWDNDAIHRACMKVRPVDRLREEFIARAVEQLVCQRLGVECDTVEHFAFVTCMEALKHGLDIGMPSVVANGVRRAMADAKTVAPLVEQILAMGAVEAQVEGGAL